MLAEPVSLAWLRFAQHVPRDDGLPGTEPAPAVSHEWRAEPVQRGRPSPNSAVGAPSICPEFPQACSFSIKSVCQMIIVNLRCLDKSWINRETPRGARLSRNRNTCLPSLGKYPLCLCPSPLERHERVLIPPPTSAQTSPSSEGLLGPLQCSAQGWHSTSDCS